MYIFELIYNITHKLIHKIKKDKKVSENSVDILSDKCEHVFLPVDSTKKTLACTKCGLLIKSENLAKHKTKNTK